MQDKIKNKDKIINEYAKIINSTKKEYQRLNTENVRYKEIFQQEQQRSCREDREEELKQYQEQKSYM